MAARSPFRRAKTQHRARELRRDLTPAERLLWGILRADRLGGLHFRRQHPIGPYIADFYCHEKRLVIELDGESHEFRIQHDADRTEYLARQRIKVLRVCNEDVLKDLENVGAGILKAVGIDPIPWLEGAFRESLKRSPPLPTLSPTGERGRHPNRNPSAVDTYGSAENRTPTQDSA